MLKISLISVYLSLTLLHAASFECRKAKTNVEKMICLDTQTSKFDSELGKLYTKIFKNLSKENQSMFKLEQRQWLNQRNKCKNYRCLRRQYASRIEVLSDMKGQEVDAEIYQFSQKKNIEITETAEEKPVSNTFTFSKKKPSDSTYKKQIPFSKTIVATGYGINKEKALKSAFKSAVEQYVGVLVDAETAVKNNKIIKDEILTASNGYIQSYHEISTENSDGLIEIQIKAVVKSQKVFDKVKSLNIATITINDSKNIYARVVSKKVAKEDAAKILKKSLNSLLSKDSIKELLILGITDVTVNEEAIKDDKVPVTVSYVMEINKKIYAQKVEQMEQTFEGLGAKLQARLDLPYYNDKNRILRVKNERKVAKTLNTDFGFIKHYGNGYKLDVWKFPVSWSDIYPFKKTRRYNLDWQDYYNLILEIKRVDGAVLIAKNITNRKSGGTLLNANVVRTRMLDLCYAGSFGDKKIVSPFLWTGYNEPYKGRRLSKVKEFYQVTIWINIEDIENLNSLSIELDEI